MRRGSVLQRSAGILFDTENNWVGKIQRRKVDGCLTWTVEPLYFLPDIRRLSAELVALVAAIAGGQRNRPYDGSGRHI
jgi:hypothetical protein